MNLQKLAKIPDIITEDMTHELFSLTWSLDGQPYVEILVEASEEFSLVVEDLIKYFCYCNKGELTDSGCRIKFERTLRNIIRIILTDRYL